MFDYEVSAEDPECFHSSLDLYHNSNARLLVENPHKLYSRNTFKTEFIISICSIMFLPLKHLFTEWLCSSNLSFFLIEPPVLLNLYALSLFLSPSSVRLLAALA